MARQFIDLRATHNPHRWLLPLDDGLCVGPPGRTFMFGGAGLAAAIAAMEGTCGRPVIWATAHYLAHARPTATLDLDVSVAAEGRHTSQARVRVHVDEREILTVNAALGERPSDLDHQWAWAPPAPAPDACDESRRWRNDAWGLHGRIEVRVARGSHTRAANPNGVSDDGRLVLWIRPREGQAIDRAMLAILADHVPSGVGHALGLNAGGRSLDNTIRFLKIVPTQWVLCDVAILGVAHGVAHGSMRLFAEDGRLMATASQSISLRIRESEPEA